MSVKCTTIHPDTEINKLLYKTFTNDLRKGYIEVGGENITMSSYYETIADDVENFEVYDSDIFVTSYPKAGTTWTQEMVWMIMNDINFEKGKESLDTRFPFLEFKCCFDYRDYPDRELPEYMDSVNFVKNVKPRPRFIKSHLPWSLLPKQIRSNIRKPKIIYVHRNPKDVCVSYYHHAVFLEGYRGNLEEYCKLFLKGKLQWSPFWKNVQGYWSRRNQENILFITYEDMKNDLESVVRKVAQFLGKDLDESKIPTLLQHLSFESMKKNTSINKSFLEEQSENRKQPGCFMRAGIVGSYKKEMSPEMIKTIDNWVEENQKNNDLPPLNYN